MARIVITGAAGFIGSTLSEYFYKLGYTVLGIDNLLYGGQMDNLLWTTQNKDDRWTFVCMDVCSSEIVSHIEKDDIVIHCAAIAPLPTNQEQPYLSVCNNIGGTINLLEACRKKGAKHFLFASTSAVYENSEVFPSRESESIEPPTLLYCSGKKYAEDCIKSYWEIYGLPYTIFRFFNVYGPHHDCLRKNPPLIGYLVSCLLEGKQPLLHSDGTQRRDYVYVDDVVSLINYVVENLTLANAKTYNICSGQTCSVREIVDTVQTILGIYISPVYRDSKLLWEKNEGLYNAAYPIKDSVVQKEVTKYSEGSYEQAKRDFQWEPKISLEEGLRSTILFAKECIMKKQV